MRLTLLIVALLYSGATPAQPSCWILSELQGVAYFQGDGYAPTADRFSKPMRLTLDGENTSVTGSDVPLRQISEFMAAGYSSGDAFTTVETYQVDPVLGVAIYTKALHGKSIFSNLSGARAFVG